MKQNQIIQWVLNNEVTIKVILGRAILIVIWAQILVGITVQRARDYWKEKRAIAEERPVIITTTEYARLKVNEHRVSTIVGVTIGITLINIIVHLIVLYFTGRLSL